MAWTKGFNFRQTAAFITDTGNNTYVIQLNTFNEPIDTYPTTRNSVTFGWVHEINHEDIGVRDRSVTPGEKFAGKVFNSNVTVSGVFRVDLPQTGTYRVRVAQGDYSYGSAVCTGGIKDNTTVKTTWDATTSAANKWIDATGVERTSDSDWTTNNAYWEGTFSSTILYLIIGNDVDKVGNVAHMEIDQMPGGVLIGSAVTGALGTKVADRAIPL